MKCPAIRRVSRGFAICGEEDGHDGPHKDPEGQVYWENLKLTFIAPLDEPAIHILKNGQSLCGMPGVPADWPKDHKWVAFNDPDNLPQATCRTCLKVHECPDCDGTGWLHENDPESLAEDAYIRHPCECNPQNPKSG